MRIESGPFHLSVIFLDPGSVIPFLFFSEEKNTFLICDLSFFPIGEMQKDEVREIAKKLALPTHDKKDSTGICFIGERRFSDFLSRFLPAQPGEIKTLDGETIGQHEGAYYYTIGQRQGLGIGGEGQPWYVAEKDVKRNIVYAVQGHDHDALMKQVVLAEQLHWISGVPPILPLYCRA